MINTMVLSDVMAGVVASAVVSVPMTVIDMGIIRAQFEKTGMGTAIRATAKDLASGKMKWNPALNIMYGVYAGTYLTANLVEHVCRTNDIPYKVPTAVATSMVNVALIGWKDQRYAETFNFTNKAAFFPKISYALFAMRDGLTIAASFVVKNDVRKMLEDDYKVEHKTADLIASFGVPMAAQLFSTPLHIAALDIYDNPTATLSQRLATVSRSYASVCFGRVIRVIPAFGVGGYLNDMMREKWEEDETVLEVENEIRHLEGGKLVRRFTTASASAFGFDHPKPKVAEPSVLQSTMTKISSFFAPKKEEVELLVAPDK